MKKHDESERMMRSESVIISMSFLKNTMKKQDILGRSTAGVSQAEIKLSTIRIFPSRVAGVLHTSKHKNKN